MSLTGEAALHTSSKIDQDQLINSGLSFDDVEKIIIAFKQVYAGVFHERIKYPE